MESFITKLKSIEQRLSKERGRFWFFALLQRDDSPGKWDLLVSAEWLQEKERKSLDHITAAIEQEFDQDDLLQLSRVVVLNPDNPIVQDLTTAFSQEHKLTRIQNITVNGMHFIQGVIITSRRPKSRRPKTDMAPA